MTENLKSRKYLFFKQSSELEILLSAAIIFASFKLNDGIASLLVDALNANIRGDSPILIGLAVSGLYLSTILPLSIAIHFIIRIYWLSLMGLKSTFPNDIDDNALNSYAPYFKKVVRSAVNLDKQIVTIDKIASSLFAFSFLSLFAFCFSFISGVFLLEILNESSLPDFVSYIFMGLLVLYAVDFFSLGVVKKIKWKPFSYFYIPIYWVLSLLTLSFLYKGIYYTLAHNLPRYFVIFVLPAYITLAVVLFNLGYNGNKLYPDDPNDEAYFGSLSNVMQYSDRFEKREYFPLQTAYIESFIVDKKYLEVSIPANYDLEDSLIAACDILPFESRGVHWHKFVSLGFNSTKYPEEFSKRENIEKVINCFSERVIMTVDSIPLIGKFILATRDNPEKVIFKTVLDLSGLKKGNHILFVQTPSNASREKIAIPFYLTSD